MVETTDDNVCPANTCDHLACEMHWHSSGSQVVKVYGRTIHSRKEYLYEIHGDGEDDGSCEEIGYFKSLDDAIEVAEDYGYKAWTLTRIIEKELNAAIEEGEMPEWEKIAFKP